MFLGRSYDSLSECLKISQTIISWIEFCKFIIYKVFIDFPQRQKAANFLIVAELAHFFLSF